MKHLFASIVLCAVLCCCGTYAHVAASGDTTIQAGVLSSIQSVTAQVISGAPGHPPTITIVQTGYDGTSVANNGLGIIVPLAGVKSAENIAKSNNHLSAVQGQQSVAKARIAKGPTVLTSTGTDAAGNAFSNQTVAPVANQGFFGRIFHHN